MIQAIVRVEPMMRLLLTELGELLGLDLQDQEYTISQWVKQEDFSESHYISSPPGDMSHRVIYRQTFTASVIDAFRLEKYCDTYVFELVPINTNACDTLLSAFKAAKLSVTRDNFYYFTELRFSNTDISVIATAVQVAARVEYEMRQLLPELGKFLGCNLTRSSLHTQTIFASVEDTQPLLQNERDQRRCLIQ